MQAWMLIVPWKKEWVRSLLVRICHFDGVCLRYSFHLKRILRLHTKTLPRCCSFLYVHKYFCASFTKPNGLCVRLNGVVGKVDFCFLLKEHFLKRGGINEKRSRKKDIMLDKKHALYLYTVLQIKRWKVA